MWIKTYENKLVNLNTIEAIYINKNQLIAVTPSHDDGDYDTYVLYERSDTKLLEKTLNELFDAIADDKIQAVSISPIGGVLIK